MTRPSLRDRCPVRGRPANVRESLLAAAREELAEVGPGRVSLRSVARRVGVSHQAVSHYFSSRAALFEEIAVEGLHELEQHFRDTRERMASHSDDEVVAALGVAYIQYAESEPGVFDLMFGSGGGLVDPHVAPVVLARQQVWQVLLDTVKDAVAHGWGGGTPAEVLALSAWSTVHGFATLSREGIGPDLGPVAVEDLLRQSLSAIRR